MTSQENKMPAAAEARQPATIRRQLIRLALACILPGIVASALLLYYSYQRERDQVERQTLQTARALVQAVDRDLIKARVVAETLAMSPLLAESDLRQFHRLASEVIGRADVGEKVMVSDGAGRQLVNTLRPFATPLPPHGGAEHLQRVFQSGQAAVSDIFDGAVLRRPVISIDVPVVRGGEVAYAISIGLLPQRFAQILETQQLPSAWVAAIFDSTGTLVARTHSPERFVGQPGAPDLVRRLRTDIEGIVDVETLEGIPVSAAFSRSSVSNWSVAIGIPRDHLAPGMLRSALALGGMVVALLIIGLWSARALGRQVAASIHALKAPALALGAGEPVVVPRLAVREAAEVGASIEAAAGLLAQRTAERDRARERADEALRLLQAMIDASPAGICVFDEQDNCLLVNREFSALVGRPVEELLGRPKPLLPEDLAKEVGAADVATFATGEARMHEISLVRDGEMRTYLAIKYPVRGEEGRVFAVAGLFTDITERKQSEGELRKLWSAVEQSPVSVVITDTSARVEYVNPAFEQISGYRADEVMGRNPRILQSGRTPRRSYEDLWAALGSGHTWMGEFINRRKDGGEYIEQVTISPIREPDGKVTHYIAVKEDITERKRAEQALLAAKAEAERANNAKSRFLAAASHDLRQPLGALSLYVGVLGGKMAQTDAGLVEGIKNCVASLNGLLTDLLDISKLQAGVVKPTVSDFAIADVLSVLVSQYRPEAQQKGLVLRCVGCRRVARTDPVLFRRIVGNFLANAIRYSEHGGVLLGCRQRYGKHWVEVWDTGVGIPADQTVEIFEEFHQLGDGARNQGSGLGLAIAARTAALLGLEIRVRSRLGRGSMFAVEFPLGQSAPDAAADPMPALSLRVALCEDNGEMRDALMAALLATGHEVTAAAGGKELVRQFVDQAPEVILSDYRLSGRETGFDVIAALRAACGADIPAIIFTGDTDPDLIRDMEGRGIAILHKPVDLDCLQDRLRQVTGR